MLCEFPWPCCLRSNRKQSRAAGKPDEGLVAWSCLFIRDRPPAKPQAAAAVGQEDLFGRVLLWSIETAGGMARSEQGNRESCCVCRLLCSPCFMSMLGGSLPTVTPLINSAWPPFNFCLLFFLSLYSLLLKRFLQITT